MNTPLMKSAAASLALLLASLGAQAQSHRDPAATPGIDRRQANQERRIDQGIASGELTRREARRLDRQQDRIDRAEAHAKADGFVSARERARLQHAQHHASRSIARQKHDGQRRP